MNGENKERLQYISRRAWVGSGSSRAVARGKMRCSDAAGVWNAYGNDSPVRLFLPG